MNTCGFLSGSVQHPQLPGSFINRKEATCPEIGLPAHFHALSRSQIELFRRAVRILNFPFSAPNPLSARPTSPISRRGLTVSLSKSKLIHQRIFTFMRFLLSDLCMRYS